MIRSVVAGADQWSGREAVYVTITALNLDDALSKPMQNPEKNIDQALMTLMIIWFALVVSQILFLAMLFFIKPELFNFDLSRPVFGPNGVIYAILGVVALSNLGLSFGLRKKYINRSVTERNILLIQTGMIIGCALCESVSLIGVFVAIAYSYPYFFVFSGLGILGTILHYPRRSDLVAATFNPPMI